MPTAPRTKWVAAADAEIDKVYEGYRRLPSPSLYMCSIQNKGNGVGWRWSDEEYTETGITHFEEELTWEEEEAWYRNHFDINNHRNSNNLIGLFTDLYDVGDAYHEMWNAWIKCDFYEMAVKLEEEDFYLLGIAPAPWDKDDLFGEGKSCAFVGCYYSTDERFWAHGSYDWVEDMREQMEDVYDEIKM